MSLLLLLLLLPRARAELALRRPANKLLLLLLVGPKKKLFVMGTKPSRAMQAMSVTMNSAVSVFW
jgi:hypothetical protein